MPLDPQIEALLQNASGWAPARTVSVEQLRTAVIHFAAMTPRLDVPLARIADRMIPGPAGDLPVRIYTPVETAPHPVLVYFHGGGWVVGNLDTQDMICRGLAHGAGCIVVSVDYRLAPEHPFPAAVDDCFAATLWAQAHAGDIGGDADRIGVGGDSAGAVLAGSVALRARNIPGLKLRGQLLFYGSMNYPSVPMPSMIEFADGPILTADDIDYFWSLYLRDPAVDQHNPEASPIRAADHAGLPPAFIGAAELDPSRDAAEAYGPALEKSGVPVVVKRYPGMPHGFMSWLGMIDMAQTATDDASAWLRTQFGAKS
jgi:acetyl esterase